MKRFALRIPADLHERLVETAAKERRSINEQILWMIENYIGEDEFDPKRFDMADYHIDLPGDGSFTAHTLTVESDDVYVLHGELHEYSDADECEAREDDPEFDPQEPTQSIPGTLTVTLERPLGSMLPDWRHRSGEDILTYAAAWERWEFTPDEDPS